MITWDIHVHLITHTLDELISQRNRLIKVYIINFMKLKCIYDINTDLSCLWVYVSC